MTNGNHAATFTDSKLFVSDKIFPFTGRRYLDACLSEIVKARDTFEGGFLGLRYFLTQLYSPRLDNSPAQRCRVLNELLMENWVELHSANGTPAVRLAHRGIKRLQELNNRHEA